MDDRAFDLWGVSRSEVVTFEKLPERIHPSDRDRVRAAFAATRAIVGAFEMRRPPAAPGPPEPIASASTFASISGAQAPQRRESCPQGRCGPKTRFLYTPRSKAAPDRAGLAWNRNAA
jgi:hypothetical protein